MKYRDLFKIYQELAPLRHGKEKPRRSELVKELLQLKDNDPCFLRYTDVLQVGGNAELYLNYRAEEGINLYPQFFRLNDITIRLIELIFWEYSNSALENYLDKEIVFRSDVDDNRYYTNIDRIFVALIDYSEFDALGAIIKFYEFLEIPLLDSLSYHSKFLRELIYE